MKLAAIHLDLSVLGASAALFAGVVILVAATFSVATDPSIWEVKPAGVQGGGKFALVVGK